MIRFAVLLLIAASLRAADYQSGQAAWAVIGQSSFTANTAGITPANLTYSNGRLYIADTAEPRRPRLLFLDTKKLPDIHEEFSSTRTSQCALCGFSPVPAPEQNVPQAPPSISVSGTAVALIDATHHTVLVWKNFYRSGLRQTPDVVLGRNKAEQTGPSAASLVEPVSVAIDGHRLFVGDAALHRVLVWNSIPTYSDQPADAVLGQANFSDSSSTLTGPGAVRTPSALASDGTRLFVADTLNHRILVFVPGDAPLASNAIVNSGSLYADPVAPGTLVTIRGSGLSEDTESAPDDGVQELPSSLGSVEVICDGSAVPLLSVSPDSIRAQIPYTLAENSAASVYVRTEHPDGTVTITNAQALRIAPATPGLFAVGKTEPRGGLLVHAADTSQSGAPVSSENPAASGEQVIVWATGLGLVRDARPSATLLSGTPYSGSAANEALIGVTALVDGRPAQVLSAGLPAGAIGVYQIRILLPRDLPANQATRLIVTQNGYTSNAVTFPVQAIGN